MSIIRYPQGSEWRKWDLQVHTPYSELNNSFGTDFEKYAQELLEKAVLKGIAAVGITDYFSIEGFKKLKELLADEKQLVTLCRNTQIDSIRDILFLPNIELRTNVIIRNPNGSDSRVNFHVIFSNEVPSDVIEEHFLHELKFTVEGNPDGSDERWLLTLKNLQDLGARLKEQHERFRDKSDLYVGMLNAVVDHGEVTKVLENKPSLFKDKYVFCLPCDEDLSRCSWDGQGHLTRKILIQKSHFLFSSNSGTREFGLGKRHSKPEDFSAEFKSFKPCINSSDAHSIAELFEPAEGRYTWIKADPTFQGLKQILNEPEDRVYVGLIPPSLERVASRSTRIATMVEIRKCTSGTTTEKWFDVSIALNPELIAVIGNKGSGKSALADILGLLGNTPRHASFSFLRNDRFRNPKNNKAKQFQTTLTWADGTTEVPVALDRDPESDSVEKIKYIPQNYLEEICNEIGLGKGSRFYAELQQVIFSHVPETERLGFSTLDELLDHRSEETHKAIEMLVSELRELNKQIIAYEERLSAQHRKTLESQLSEKRRELEAHNQTKPKEVLKPEEDTAAQQQSKSTAEVLEKKQAELKVIEKQVEETREAESRLARKRSTAEKLLAKIQNLQRQITTALSDAEEDFKELGLNQSHVFSITVNTDPIEVLLKSIDEERNKVSKQLDGEEQGSLQHRRLATHAEIEELQKKLSAPQQEYQAYLQKLKEWGTTLEKITGSEQLSGSIKYIENQLANLEELPKVLRRFQKQRDRKSLEIFREKQKLRGYYAAYYGAVQRFLGRHPLAASERFRLTFNVSIVDTGFADAFLNQINQRRVGPYAGVEEGAAELKRLLDTTNFDSALGTLRFTRKLFCNMRKHDGRMLDIKDQLKQGNSLQDFYDFVFSLSYLSPIYNLRWDAKRLEQLSPGERGNLLLIFYLLVDRDDIPLVIDQPEENLDNQTVYKTLVPCIKDAKKRRQIILVTHNPNLAVVCDAEQVICAEIKKDVGNEVFYTSGSIEDPLINQRIVDILEGTRPAFDKRDDKYL